jgi:hypothetical protein
VRDLAARWRPRRSAVLAAVAVLTIAGVAVGSYFAGTRMKSPAQAAAEAAPPAASVVTVPLERRVLSEPMVLRGRVERGASVRVLVPAGASGPDSVITKVNAKAGSRLEEGSVIAVRSGQPLIALVLPFPLYRDITGGETGPDVVEVQRVLRRLGYSVRTSGTVDDTTQRALGRLYSDRGFPAQPGSADAATGLPAAEASVAAAQRALDAAVAAQSGVAEAQAQLTEATRIRDGLRVSAGPSLPRSAVVRVDKTGRTITTVAISVGTVLDSATAVLLELDGEADFLVANATTDQARLLHPGQAASVVNDATGTTVAVTVDRVGSAVATPAPSGGTDPTPSSGDEEKLSGVEIRFVAVSAPLPPAGDASYRVDVTTNASAEPVLAAPITAIYSRPDGTSFVTVYRAGTTVDVTVVVGAIAGGWVEITSSDGTLAEGTEVVVGHGGGIVAK